MSRDAIGSSASSTCPAMHVKIHPMEMQKKKGNSDVWEGKAYKQEEWTAGGVQAEELVNLTVRICCCELKGLVPPERCVRDKVKDH